MQIEKVKEIKKINAISLANAVALMYGFVGFFASFILAVSIIAFLIANENSGGSIILITLFNIGAGLLLGVLSFAFTASIGWVMGYAAAWIYNWFAKKSGGIKIELADYPDEPNKENNIS